MSSSSDHLQERHVDYDGKARRRQRAVDEQANPLTHREQARQASVRVDAGLADRAEHAHLRSELARRSLPRPKPCLPRSQRRPDHIVERVHPDPFRRGKAASPLTVASLHAIEST
jgi:hypothetical protein